MLWWCAAVSGTWGIAMGSGMRFRLTGGMPERFIDKALAAGVRIRDCRRMDERLMELYVPRADAAALQQLAEKYGVECESMGARGVSALAERLVRRRSALAGSLAMLLTAALLISRIWLVQVLPVDATGDAVLEQVRQALVESGAHPGISAWQLDCAQLRSRLISAVPDIGYVAVKREGVCLVVEVSQAVAPPATYDIGAARDIVAMYDGVVQRVDVYAGTAAVESGATVRRGDVLIYGYERASGELVGAVAADGVVTARVWQTAEVSAPANETVLFPTGRQSQGEALNVLGWSLPITQADGFDAEVEQTEFLPVGGIFVPVGIVRTTHTECYEQQIDRDESELKRQLLDEAEAILDETMPFRARVIDKWTNYSMIDSGELYMKLTRELEVDIAASGRAE